MLQPSIDRHTDCLMPGRSKNDLALRYHKNKLNMNGMYEYHKGYVYLDLTISRSYPEFATALSQQFPFPFILCSSFNDFNKLAVCLQAYWMSECNIIPSA